VKAQSKVPFVPDDFEVPLTYPFNIPKIMDSDYKSINEGAKMVALCAGIYLYQIQAGEYISTKKMVLLK